jgi:hypothetical protein
MRRARLLLTLLMVALCLSVAGVAAAQPAGPGNGNGGNGGNGGGKPPKARITWSEPRVAQTLAAGQTATVKVTLTSSADLANVALQTRGGLGRILSVSPASFSLTAGQAKEVTLTITMPADRAQCQGGVVQVRAGNRVVPANLKVKVTVPGATGCES